MRIVNQLWFVSTHPLKRDHKLRAVLGYLRWLVGIRLLGGEHVYEWVNGSRLLVRQGEAISANVYTGIEEFADMGYLLHVLRKDDLFVDVGANAGAYTVLACAAVGARGHAFEPVPATYQRLLQNLHLNHLEGWVVGHNIGLGSAPGRAAFTTAQGSTNHVLAVGEPSALAIEVEMSTLDHALAEEAPSVLKIDVEGYETPVLQGAGETLKKKSLHSVILELDGSGSRYGYREDSALALMQDHGFRPYTYEPLTRTLIPLHGKHSRSRNTLFIRGVGEVAERLRAAPPVTIQGRRF